MQDEALHIAVAVIFSRDRQQVLLSKRPKNVDQGGLWEFPGGKCEKDESIRDALGRELMEELGMCVEEATPFIQVKHRYPEYSVLLDVWCVDRWSGDVSGREGQQVEWVKLEALEEKEFPRANEAIIRAIQALQ